MPRWQLDVFGGLTVSIGRPGLVVLACLALLGLSGVASLARRVQALEAEVARLAGDRAGVGAREHTLEATVARQHRTLLEREGELETLRYQIEAVELQLDSIDYLSNQLRGELGLPPGEATWAGSAAPADGQGGPDMPPPPEAERIGLIQRRLAAGIAELVRLQVLLRERAAGAPAAAALEPADPRPANWPARGPVTSAFGRRVFRERPSFHTGIDIGLPYNTPVQATGHGIVVGSGWQPSYGRSVLLQHGDGYSTLYAHLASSLVKLGDRVAPGDPIGLAGSSGNSTGPHLHYEIWKDGQVLDPRPFMDGTGP